MDKIELFDGEYRWLSNFWIVKIVFGERIYPSVENAYQAAKYPEYMRDRFIDCTPAAAKRLGAQSKLPRDVWNARKVPIMHGLLLKKFRLGGELALWLENTGDAEIIEGNTWNDTFWGVCKGVGENQLGKLLMEVRATNRDAIAEMTHGS
jgi:ribA/ribD-fused uncharacterized protein